MRSLGYEFRKLLAQKRTYLGWAGLLAIPFLRASTGACFRASMTLESISTFCRSASLNSSARLSFDSSSSV